MLRRMIEHVEEAVISLLLAAMTLLTFVQVVLRYVFNSGFIWALEAVGYMFGWLVLFGISYAARIHAHIGIDVLVKLLSDKGRRWVGLLAVGLTLLYAGFMIYGSYFYLDRLFRLGIHAEDIPVPRWVLGLILPIGFILFGIRLLQQALAIWRGRAKGFDLADEAAEALQDAGLKR
jgi:C4-dicarboxylate transporter DctQ subunit